MALLDRGYGLPVPADVVEEGIKEERRVQRVASEIAQERARKDKARALLAARWEQLTPGQRRVQLDGLRETAAEWQAQAKWVEAHLEAVSIESLASGETGWTQGEVPGVELEGDAHVTPRS